MSKDHDQPHAPDVQCMAVFLPDEKTSKIERRCDRSDLKDISAESYQLLIAKLGIKRFFDIMATAIPAEYAQMREYNGQ